MPDRIDYLCPQCGQITSYARDSELKSYWILRRIDEWWGISDMRNRLAKLPGIAARFDETALCHACAAPGSEPGVSLVLTWPDGTSTHSPNLEEEDLSLLEDFCQGQSIHIPHLLESPRSSLSALKDDLPRIKLLLGLP